MKIALICTEKLPVPPVAGGAVQIYIEGILPKISKEHDITVYSVNHPSLPDEEEVDNIKYIRVSGQNKNEYIKNIILKLTNDFDLIHIFNRPNYVLKLSKAYPDTKISLSLHNEMFHIEKIPISAAIECINKVEFISTVSNFIAEGVKKLYPMAEGKIFPVYSGVNVNVYKPVQTVEGAEIKEILKQKYGIEDKKVVLFVGRLSIKKGVDKLLNAMKKVMSLRNDVALVVIGSKWYGNNTYDEYTEKIDMFSKNLNGPVIFTGFLSPAQIPNHYNLGDIFVCPSQWNEPLARVHYEAMAAGLPIITTNRGGNSEVIKGYGNGIVIDDYTNSDVFADMIIELLNNEAKAQEMGRTGRILAEKKYSWNRVADDLLKLFKRVKENLLLENENEPIKNSVPDTVTKPAETYKADEVEKFSKVTFNVPTKASYKELSLENPIPLEISKEIYKTIKKDIVEEIAVDAAKEMIRNTSSAAEKEITAINAKDAASITMKGTLKRKANGDLKELSNVSIEIIPKEISKVIKNDFVKEIINEPAKEIIKESVNEKEVSIDSKKVSTKKKNNTNPYLTAAEEYYLKLFEDYLD